MERIISTAEMLISSRGDNSDLRQKLEKQVKCIITDFMDMKKQTGIHPLFLGLHHGRDIWKLVSYPVQEELKMLEDALKPKAEKDGSKKSRKNGESKDYAFWQQV